MKGARDGGREEGRKGTEADLRPSSEVIIKVKQIFVCKANST